MTDTGYWWLALGLGLVAAAVAVALLQRFLGQVWRVEHDAEQVWAAGKRVAGNTASTWLLQQTSGGLDRLADEAGRHEQLLRGIGGGSR